MLHSLWLIVILFLALPSLALAQQKQAWIDYFGTLQFSPRWALELNPGTAYLAAEGGWRDYYAAGTAMFTPLNWLELQGGLEGHYTVDPVQENSVEIRPSLASVFTWATYGRYLNLFYPFFMAKYEERFISYQESGTSQTLSRLRLSAGARFPLNSPILDPGTWYLKFKLETYYDLNGEPNIRYASKRRFDAGAGYVLTPAWRLEAALVLMSLRDQTDDSYHPNDLVFWFAARHWF